MSNPSRKKGTEGENFFLPGLRNLFYPGVPHDDDHPLQRLDIGHGDFLGVPWLHEAKNTAKPLFQKWARNCEGKAGDKWVILWKGDLRKSSGEGPYVLMPLAHYEHLVRGDHLGSTT